MNTYRPNGPSRALPRNDRKDGDVFRSTGEESRRRAPLFRRTSLFVFRTKEGVMEQDQEAGETERSEIIHTKRA